MRERGLKQGTLKMEGMTAASLPMRERGLKRFKDGYVANAWRVAPHAGAWIETSTRPSTAWARRVAPHAGAWIETANGLDIGKRRVSLPMRERGLKLPV